MSTQPGDHDFLSDMHTTSVAREAVGLGDARTLRKYLENALHGRGRASAGVVDERRGWRMCLLHLAAFQGSVDTVILLLAAGATVNSRDLDGWTPLHYAARNEAHGGTLVRTLVAAGADVSRADNRGRTALHIAYLCRNSRAASELLEQGASTTLKDRHGKTAPQMLQQRKPPRRRPWSGSSAIPGGPLEASPCRRGLPCPIGLPTVQQTSTRAHGRDQTGGGFDESVVIGNPMASAASGSDHRRLNPPVLRPRSWACRLGKERREQRTAEAEYDATGTTADGSCFSVDDGAVDPELSKSTTDDSGSNSKRAPQSDEEPPAPPTRKYRKDGDGELFDHTRDNYAPSGSIIAAATAVPGNTSPRTIWGDESIDATVVGCPGGEEWWHSGRASTARQCRIAEQAEGSEDNRERLLSGEGTPTEPGFGRDAYRGRPETRAEGEHATGVVRAGPTAAAGARLSVCGRRPSPEICCAEEGTCSSAPSRRGIRCYQGRSGAGGSGGGSRRKSAKRKMCGRKVGGRRRARVNAKLSAARAGRAAGRENMPPSHRLTLPAEIPDYIAGERRWAWAQKSAADYANRTAAASSRRERIRSPRRLKVAAAAALERKRKDAEEWRKERARRRPYVWGRGASLGLRVRPSSSPAASSCPEGAAARNTGPYGGRSCVKCDAFRWHRGTFWGTLAGAGPKSPSACTTALARLVDAGGSTRRSIAESYRFARQWTKQLDGSELWWARDRDSGGAARTVVVKTLGSDYQKWEPFAREWAVLKYLQEDGNVYGGQAATFTLVDTFVPERCLVLAVPTGTVTLREVGERLHASLRGTKETGPGTRAFHQQVPGQAAAGFQSRVFVQLKDDQSVDKVEMLAVEACCAVCLIHRCGLVHGDITPDTFAIPGGIVEVPGYKPSAAALRGKSSMDRSEVGGGRTSGRGGGLRLVGTRCVALRTDRGPRHPLLQLVGPSFPPSQPFDKIYASPERLAAELRDIPCKADAAVDAWGLGTTIYWLLNGRDYAIGGDAPPVAPGVESRPGDGQADGHHLERSDERGPRKIGNINSERAEAKPVLACTGKVCALVPELLASDPARREAALAIAALHIERRSCPTSTRPCAAIGSPKRSRRAVGAPKAPGPCGSMPHVLAERDPCSSHEPSSGSAAAVVKAHQGSLLRGSNPHVPARLPKKQHSLSTLSSAVTALEAHDVARCPVLIAHARVQGSRAKTSGDQARHAPFGRDMNRDTKSRRGRRNEEFAPLPTETRLTKSSDAAGIIWLVRRDDWRDMVTPITIGTGELDAFLAGCNSDLVISADDLRSCREAVQQGKHSPKTAPLFDVVNGAQVRPCEKETGRAAPTARASSRDGERDEPPRVPRKFEDGGDGIRDEGEGRHDTRIAKGCFDGELGMYLRTILALFDASSGCDDKTDLEDDRCPTASAGGALPYVSETGRTLEGCVKEIDLSQAESRPSHKEPSNSMQSTSNASSTAAHRSHAPRAQLSGSHCRRSASYSEHVSSTKGDDEARRYRGDRVILLKDGVKNGRRGSRSAGCSPSGSSIKLPWAKLTPSSTFTGQIKENAHVTTKPNLSAGSLSVQSPSRSVRSEVETVTVPNGTAGESSSTDCQQICQVYTNQTTVVDHQSAPEDQAAVAEVAGGDHGGIAATRDIADGGIEDKPRRRKGSHDKLVLPRDDVASETGEQSLGTVEHTKIPAGDVCFERSSGKKNRNRVAPMVMTYGETSLYTRGGGEGAPLDSGTLPTLSVPVTAADIGIQCVRSSERRAPPAANCGCSVM